MRVLLCALTARKLLPEVRVVGITHEFLEPVEVGDPALADGVGDELGLLGVGLSLMKRRGVTPLVTLVKRSGHSSEKSFSTLSLSNSLCRAATPLTLTDATVAKWAIRTERSGWSAMIDIRRTRSSSPG
jgi:hypothetical protein